MKTLIVSVGWIIFFLKYFDKVLQVDRYFAQNFSPTFMIAFQQECCGKYSQTKVLKRINILFAEDFLYGEIQRSIIIAVYNIYDEIAITFSWK